MAFDRVVQKSAEHPNQLRQIDIESMSDCDVQAMIKKLTGLRLTNSEKLEEYQRLFMDLASKKTMSMFERSLTLLRYHSLSGDEKRVLSNQEIVRHRTMLVDSGGDAREQSLNLRDHLWIRVPGHVQNIGQAVRTEIATPRSLLATFRLCR